MSACIGDMGAYLQLVTPGIPLLGAFLYAGVYDLPKAYDFSCTSVFTTMTPTDAYRGAGRPEATYAIERAMDSLAAKMGVDPLELRRRNFIATDKYPYEAYSGLVYDSGNHDGAATKAAEMLGYDELRARQATQNVDGATKRLGVGVTSYFEMCGLAPSRVLASLNYSAGGWEAATVRVLPTSKVQVVTGSSPHGQGHETAWSMIVADKMGISPDDVDVLHSDTAIAPLGLDTYGSRSLAGRRRRDRDGVRQGHRQGQADRRPPARSVGRRPRVRGRGVHGQGIARQDRCRSRRSPSRRSPPTTCPTGWSPTSKPRSRTTRRTSRGRSAPTCAPSRSTPRPGMSRC